MRARRSPRFVHWIALVALWFAALAPTLSHALAAAPARQAALPADLCAVIDPADGADGATPGGHGDPAGGGWLDHCPLCPLQAHTPVLPGAAPAAWVGDPRAFAVPRLFLHAGRTLHAWASAQARAPPALA